MKTKTGYYGQFGGCFVAETLMTPLQELAKAYQEIVPSAEFQAEYRAYLKNFVGRPTPLTFARRLTEQLGGAQIYLKREDLAHTGAHKINNSLGQVLLAKYMGKRRVVAETGAGQHGVATATVAAMLGLECVICMGVVDMQRQAINVERMRLLGAEVIPVTYGTQTLKDAVSEALRYYVAHVDDTLYVLGSALGPHPYPAIVRDFQKVIGEEARAQCIEHVGRLPDLLIACIGGGSNAIGLFYPFINDESVGMIGVEAGGHGIATGQHAARFAEARIGVLHGTKTYLMQDSHGQILPTHSISAGLDYPAIGPQHADYYATGRVQYTSATDKDAMEALHLLTRLEGILPALESAHAIAEVIKKAPQMDPSQVVIVNLSGRGDKDIHTIINYQGE